MPMVVGFMYFVAIMDWFSRYVVAWAVSNSLDVGFCLKALEQALATQAPEILNSDQGVQFTSQACINCVEAAGSAVSMDGRGRAFDNIFIEGLWRSVKYEDIILRDYATGPELVIGLGAYSTFYNHERPHQALAIAPQRRSMQWKNCKEKTILFSQKFCLDNGVQCTPPRTSGFVGLFM